VEHIYKQTPQPTIAFIFPTHVHQQPTPIEDYISNTNTNDIFALLWRVEFTWSSIRVIDKKKASKFCNALKRESQSPREALLNWECESWGAAAACSGRERDRMRGWSGGGRGVVRLWNQLRHSRASPALLPMDASFRPGSRGARILRICPASRVRNWNKPLETKDWSCWIRSGFWIPSELSN